MAMKNISITLILLFFLRNISNAQIETRVQIDASDNVNYIIIDPFGHKTGVDSRQTQNKSDWIWYEEIPNSNYGLQSEGSLDPINHPADISPELMFGFNSPQADGDYIIKVYGWKTGLFWIGGEFYQYMKYVTGCKFYLKNLPIEKDSTITYKVCYHGIKNKSTYFIKIVDASSLIRDIHAMQAIGWIQNQTTTLDYTQLYGTVGLQIADSNIIGARTTLNIILNNLLTDSASAISGDAYKLLSTDTRQLLNQLPKISQCIVKLVNSSGLLLNSGTLQYRDSTWKDAANNNDGTFTINTTKEKLSLRMTYAYGTQTKSNVTIGIDTIIFQTKNVVVNLQNSQGSPLDTGIVQYNSSSGWQDFGSTSYGAVTKELLPVKYTFRMTYNGAVVSKVQNIDSNATVLFQTVPVNVQLQTSAGAPLDTGIVQFNAEGWKPFGTTTNGLATKELLTTKYNFRMTYDGATVSQAQNIDSNATVVFQTVRTLVQFNNSKGNPIDTGVVQFNSGGWQNYGSTSNGIVSKELLPVKYTFRLAYCGSTVSIAQNVDSNATVVFSTVLCTVSVTNSSGSLLNNATVSYNAGGWNVIGTTVNGIVTKELLPVKIQFRAAYGSKQQSVTQDVSTNPFIAITLPVQ